MLDDRCYAVIMAGGYGTRLWPLSRKNKPKQWLKLFDGKCLIELTLEHLQGHIPDDRILILTNVNYATLARDTLPRIPHENVICEPCARDTASAIGLAATVLQQRCESATMIVLTADQIIEPADRFNAALANATRFLAVHPEMLVAFGVTAAFASTLVGWQKLGEALDFPDCEVRRIEQFTEKPDPDTARRYVVAGGYCWNSGQFAWKAETILAEIAAYLPDASDLLKQIGDAWNTRSRDRVLNALFPRMPQGSIDYKIMQKTRNACSIFLPCRWEDMGTPAALARRIGTTENGNSISGNAIVTGTGNTVLNLVDSPVIVAHDNLIVVVTENTVFIGDSEVDMKALIETVAQRAPEIL